MSDTPRVDAFVEANCDCEPEVDYCCPACALAEEVDAINAELAAARAENAALREQLAERDAEIAALKAHAEAMALDLEYIFQHDDASGGSEALPEYRAAYRADFPEGAK